MLGVWPDVKTWLKKAIDGYKIDGITRKGGLVVWAGDIKKDQTITFFENKNAADLKAAIDGLPSPTGGTKGGKALTFTYENLFKTGSDPSALRKIVFLTDGDSTDSMKGPAEQFHKNGIQIDAVALGSGVNVRQLNEELLCTDCGDRLFTSNSSDDLITADFLDQLTSCQNSTTSPAYPYPYPATALFL